ncbi:GNAT family N-acetyltransferase [Stenotrophomonas sp. LGBM10]|uniref:GNAT family N-acetyltransferase n=1 Tax=Stenotrophomonas sp. LGBM10 TaxID=3390038 RepID=UPI00398A5430
MTILHTPASGHPDVTLRPLLRSDAPAWFACLSRPGLLRHTSWQVASVAELAPLFDALEAPEPATQIRLAIVDTAGTLVGSIGFHSINPAQCSAEIAYELVPEFQGRGIASATCRQVCAWGFARFGWQRIQACVLDTNAASAAVLRRCGFEHEGRLRRLRRVAGHSRDFDVYACLAPDGTADLAQG